MQTTKPRGPPLPFHTPQHLLHTPRYSTHYSFGAPTVRASHPQRQHPPSSTRSRCSSSYGTKSLRGTFLNAPALSSCGGQTHGSGTKG